MVIGFLQRLQNKVWRGERSFISNGLNPEISYSTWLRKVMNTNQGKYTEIPIFFTLTDIFGGLFFFTQPKGGVSKYSVEMPLFNTYKQSSLVSFLLGKMKSEWRKLKEISTETNFSICFSCLCFSVFFYKAYDPEGKPGSLLSPFKSSRKPGDLIFSKHLVDPKWELILICFQRKTSQ